MTGRQACVVRIALAVCLLAPMASAGAAPGAARIFHSGFETLPCIGLECSQVDCAGPGTTVSGTVFAPNATLPLPNVIVYVPNAAVQDLAAGAQCARCDVPPSGSPLVSTRTGADGKFVLADMPATTQVPLVIQSGKWRRQFVLPSVAACTDTAVASGTLRFARNQSEGDLPRIALSTGGADSQECLLRKIGIADAEFTPAGGSGRVHLYAGVGGTDAIDAANGGEALASSTDLWANQSTLDAYDLVLLSCEGAPNEITKPLAAREALQAYADAGGRVLLVHWHNFWVQSGPSPWPAIATWNFRPDLPATTMDIATGFGRGDELAQWVVAAGLSAVPAKVALSSAKHTVTAVDPLRARRRVFRDVTANNLPTVQYFSFTTPVDDPIDARCGRVAFSEFHASQGDASGPALAFPSGGCTTPADQLSAPEKLGAYALFDLGSCVGNAIE